jgi:peptidoglycan/xylan/chitin deacetylase (PgdA/CDA1 family)
MLYPLIVFIILVIIFIFFVYIADRTWLYVVLAILFLLLIFYFIIYFFQLDIAKVVYRKKAKFVTKDVENIALTIDDVIYDKSAFEEILSLLDSYNVKAVFFLIGGSVNDENRPILIKAIKSGHVLGNHGMTNSMHASLSRINVEKEIKDCDNIIEELYKDANIKREKKYYRPGHGFISSHISQICCNEGYKVILGSVYPRDPYITSPYINYIFITDRIKDKDIIILHDREWTPHLLYILIPELVVNRKFKFTVDL